MLTYRVLADADCADWAREAIRFDFCVVAVIIRRGDLDVRPLSDRHENLVEGLRLTQNSHATKSASIWIWLDWLNQLYFLVHRIGKDRLFRPTK
jgi:hypothetical protein